MSVEYFLKSLTHRNVCAAEAGPTATLGVFCRCIVFPLDLSHLFVALLMFIIHFGRKHVDVL